MTDPCAPRQFVLSWFSDSHWGLQQVGPISGVTALELFRELLDCSRYSSLRLREVDEEGLEKNGFEV